MAVPKLRLDKLLLQLGFAPTSEKAQAMILSGNVLVNEVLETKAGTLVREDVKIRLKSIPTPYVSRGGEKLRMAHDFFRFSILDRVALDVGISTGGFTDFLLQNGAKQVIGIDVGYGQVDHKISSSNQVVVIERTNARSSSRQQIYNKIEKITNKSDLLSQVDLVVMDVSFVSVLKVLPNVVTWLSQPADFLVLLKPQFEALSEQVEFGGIVRNEAVRQEILNGVESELIKMGFQSKGRVPVLKGTKGNQEEIVWLRYEC